MCTYRDYTQTHFCAETKSSLNISREISRSSVRKFHFEHEHNPGTAALSGLGQSTPCHSLVKQSDLTDAKEWQY